MENILYFYVIQFCFTGLVKNYVVNLKNKLWLLCTVYFHAIDQAIDQNSQNKIILCFVHPIFRFWFLVTFGDEVTKIFRNLYLHFASKDGQEGKKTERKSRN